MLGFYLDRYIGLAIILVTLSLYVMERKVVCANR